MAKTDPAVADPKLRTDDIPSGPEDLFQELVAGSLQGVLVYGDMGPLFCSDLAARIFGYGTGERFLAEGPRDFHDLIVPEQRDAFRDLAEELRMEHSRRAEQQFDLRALRRDGAEIWIVLKRRPITWRGEAAILVTVYDITRLKTSELRFHEFEGRFQRLVDSTQAIVVHVAGNGQIRMVNRAAEEVIGLPRSRIIGLPWQATVDAERMAILLPAIERVMSGETVEVADAIRDASGRLRTLSAQIVPETGLSGAVHGFFYVALDTTEREAAAQALREGEERYRSLVEGSLQAIALLQDGEPIFVNETFARIFGYDSPQDYLAQGVRHIADHFLAEDSEDIAAILSLSAADQDLPAREGRVLDAQGREIWLEYLVRPCVIGSEVLSQFTALDITERKQSVSALHESELLLRNLIDQSPAYIACLDTDGRYIFANAPLADLLGFPVAQIRGKAALGESAAARFPIHAAAMKAALAGRTEIVQTEISVNDDLHILESNYFPRWSGSEIVGVFVVAFDVTERERSTRALRASEERFRKLIEVIPYGITRVDRDGVIRLSNPAHDRLLGYAPGELEGKVVWDLFVPEEQDMQRESFRAIARARPAPFPNLGRYRDVNGKVLDVLFNWNYEYNADGQVDGFISVITDVTEELHAKRELHFAKEQAERANIEKSRFLAAASHDLQQPLHSLSILLGLLAGQKDEEKRQNIIATMGRAVEGARVLLRAVLDLSKLEAGVVVPRPEAIPVDDLMEQVLAELGPQAESKGLDLRVVRSNLQIWSDRLLIKGIFHNLVSNAIRYTAKGKILLGGRRKGDHFVLQVWDTGKGIPKDKQREIFREFTRLESSQDDREQSYALGLGLSIVERMCDLLGHRITVQSEVGKGSCFSVEVPLARTAAVEARKPLSHGRIVAPATFRSGLILLIEDNATTALATRQLIEEWGHRCLVAMNQADALSLAQGENQLPDLIVADYNLDGAATGIDVARQIMEMAGKDIPTILVTANDSPACLDEARKYDIPVLSKPANPARLRALIAFSLARGDAPDA